jgi:hypothetical protein
MRRILRRPLILILIAGIVVVCGLLAVEQYLQPGPNYDRIEDGLYLGGRIESPPWRTRAVLNLCEQADPYSCEVHVHEPIPDAAPAPSVDWLRKQVEWIELQRREGRKVYVHCLNGVSRSGMVVTAYLMYEHNWSMAEALAFVQSKRSGVRPNPAFRPLLEKWEHELRATER